MKKVASHQYGLCKVFTGDVGVHSYKLRRLNTLHNPQSPLCDVRNKAKRPDRRNGKTMKKESPAHGTGERQNAMAMH